MPYVAIMRCPYCGKEIGIALDNQLRDDAFEGKYVSDPDPCDECKKKLDDNNQFILVIIDNNMNPVKYVYINRDGLKPGTIKDTDYVALMKEDEFNELCDN